MVSAKPKAQADQAQHVGLLLGCRSAQQGGWFEDFFASNTGDFTENDGDFDGISG